MLLVSKKSSLIPRSQKPSPMFSSGSCIVFESKVRCRIHFELIFVYGSTGYGLRFISVAYDIQPHD